MRFQGKYLDANQFTKTFQNRRCNRDVTARYALGRSFECDHSVALGPRVRGDLMKELRMNIIVSLCMVGGLMQAGAPATPQHRPDFSGIWRLDPSASRMIGGGGPPSDQYQLTWLVNHREPHIEVVVNVRNAFGSREFTFRCTTDGKGCVNELASINEVRRMAASWEANELVMSQQATSPHGGFTAMDRLRLEEGGQRLVFERIVTNDRGDRPVKQVFRKLGPHPSQRQPPAALPIVDLPADLARVLRDYERHWHAGNADALVSLFTEDGLVARRGGWIRGTAALREALQRTSSQLRLRPVAYSVDEQVGYIVGAFGYGDQPSTPDRGLFILTLRKSPAGRWLIAADLDISIRPE